MTFLNNGKGIRIKIVTGSFSDDSVRSFTLNEEYIMLSIQGGIACVLGDNNKLQMVDVRNIQVLSLTDAPKFNEIKELSAKAPPKSAKKPEKSTKSEKVEKKGNNPTGNKPTKPELASAGVE